MNAPEPEPSIVRKSRLMIDRALKWLADHPHSSALQICQGINCDDYKLLYELLKAAERGGKVQRSTEGHVWLWEVTS